jgi:glycosyltransferase involved in cell wall biosynthesis
MSHALEAQPDQRSGPDPAPLDVPRPEHSRERTPRTIRDLRVLMVAGRLPTADAPNALASVARQIESVRRLGISVDVLEIDGPPRVKYVRALAQLRQQVGAVDLVHAHYGFSGWVARVQASKPVVVSFMGDDLLGTPGQKGRATARSRVAVQINRWLARTVDRVIVKSEEMARIVSPVEATVVPNGVDLEAFRPMDRRQARGMLGWADDRRYVLFPGDPAIPRKGFTLANATLERVRRGLGQSIELVPLRGIPSDRVPLVMNACDALLMVSLSEGSPNAVKEALACDVPVISVPVGDTPELLADVSGTALCPRDPDALSAALSRMLRDSVSCEGRAAIIRRRLDRDSVARTIASIYVDVLARRGAQITAHR